MKNKEEIEQLAKKLCNIPIDLVIDEEERYYKNFQKYDGVVLGYNQCQEDMTIEITNNNREWAKQCGEISKELKNISTKNGITWSDEDMLKIAEYAYNFRATTQFPEHEFSDSCINNTKQYMEYLKTLK